MGNFYQVNALKMFRIPQKKKKKDVLSTKAWSFQSSIWVMRLITIQGQ